MHIDELISGCLAGNKRHFKELYEKYSSGLYGICLRYSGDEEEARDILQEGFIKVFMHLKSFDKTKGSFEGWLKRIFINLSIDYYRKKPHTISLDAVEYISGEIAEEEDEPDYDLSQEQLLELIRDLPQGYRTVFNLYAIDNKPHKEIAELMGISESTSKTQYFKARKELQSKIKGRMLTSYYNPK